MATRFVEFPGFVDSAVFHIDANRIVAVGTHRDAGKAYIWTGSREDDCFVVGVSPAEVMRRIGAAVEDEPTGWAVERVVDGLRFGTLYHTLADAQAAALPADAYRVVALHRKGGAR